ncbi:hypothetical protein [Streptomyces sp. NPDC058751]|uniref:hypothetical protein n=1 Tax=Streptomyces sp. NPDC058751 TaxID=3346623 RepID=UPI00369FF69A
MRTNKINTAQTAAVAVGAILATGCGAGAGPADPVAATTALSSSSASAPFGQKAVRTDLQAAVAAAGLADGKVEVKLGMPRKPHAPTDTEKGRETAALTNRLASCAVSWSSTEKRYRSPHAADRTGTQRQLEVMLSDLSARGWKESLPPQKGSPGGDDSTYFMTSYKKKGWLLYAQHVAVPPLDLMTVTATEEACFSRLTDEEQALIEN